MEQSQEGNPANYVLLVELNQNNWIAKIKIEHLLEQKLNARTMPRDMFRQLTANIQGAGDLVESLPFCALTDKGVEIVSGHHRVRAARAAGILEIHIILNNGGLTRSQIISKQISHNALAGQDDPQILKELFEQIEDAEARIAAFIDPKALNIPEPPSIEIGDINTDVNFKHVAFVFLPHQMDKFEEVIEEIKKDTTMLGVAEMEGFEKFKKTVQKVREIDDIRAVGMILSRMCDICLAHYKPIEDKLIEERKVAPAETLDMVVEA